MSIINSKRINLSGNKIRNIPMKTEMKFSQRKIFLLMMLFCLFGCGVLGGWLSSVRGQTANSLSSLVVDDFNRAKVIKIALSGPR